MELLLSLLQFMFLVVIVIVIKGFVKSNVNVAKELNKDPLKFDLFFYD